MTASQDTAFQRKSQMGRKGGGGWGERRRDGERRQERGAVFVYM